MLWKSLVAPFAWLTGTVRSLCGSQRDETPIEKDIEDGRQNFPSSREGSYRNSSNKGIRPRIDDLETSIWYAWPIYIALQLIVLKLTPARHVLPSRLNPSQAVTLDPRRTLLGFEAAHSIADILQHPRKWDLKHRLPDAWKQGGKAL
jgi:hypothetical protein